MKRIRWKDFSLVSKIVIEVGLIAVLLFTHEPVILCADQYFHAENG